MRYDHLGMLPDKAFSPIGKRMTLEGGSKGGSAPKAPDYMALAQQQANLQQQLINQTTAANRVNQVTPYGSLTWSRNGASAPTFDQAGYDRAMADYNRQASASSQSSGGPLHAFWQIDQLYNKKTPGYGSASASAYGAGGLKAPSRDDFMTGATSGGGGVGDWTATTTLTPELQAILDQNISAKGQSYDQLQRSLSRINSNDLPQGPINPGQTAQDAIMARLNPTFNTEDDRVRTRLYNQGVRAGSEAWDNEMRNFERARNDAYSQAALQGINLDFQNRNQALQEQAIPINLINAYQSGGQAQMPQFQNYAQQAQGQAPDLMGAAQGQYQGQLNSYNASQASDNNFMGGLFSLGGAALGGGFGGGGVMSYFSDRRLKTDIEHIGKYDNGLNKYRWNYIWGEPGEGVMADEVEIFMPHAVGERNGFKTVNYAMLGV
jgi:hypothetical protein